jgi:hypothetical protein
MDATAIPGLSDAPGMKQPSTIANWSDLLPILEDHPKEFTAIAVFR